MTPDYHTSEETARSQSDEQSKQGTPEAVTFTEWRRQRPLAGGLLLVTGGAIVAWFPMTALATFGTSFEMGLGLLVGLGVVLSGLATILRPEYSSTLALIGLALSSASFLFTLGGFVAGMLLGGIGGVLCFAWSPPEEETDGVDGTE